MQEKGCNILAPTKKKLTLNQTFLHAGKQQMEIKLYNLFDDTVNLEGVFTIYLQVIFDVQAMTQPCKTLPPVYGSTFVCVPAPLIPLDPPPAGRLLRNVKKGDVIRLDRAVLNQTAERRLKGPVTPAEEDPPSVGFPSGESRRRISGRLLALRLASFP